MLSIGWTEVVALLAAYAIVVLATPVGISGAVLLPFHVSVLATPARAYVTVAGLTVLNPLTAAYCGTLVVGHQTSAPLTASQAAVFVAAVFVASAGWQTLLAGGGALIGRLVTSPRGMLATAVASSLLTGLLALRIPSP